MKEYKGICDLIKSMNKRYDYMVKEYSEVNPYVVGYATALDDVRKWLISEVVE